MKTTPQVREYFKEMGEGTAVQCAKALGQSWTRVYKSMMQLQEKGWLEKIEGTRGLYKFHQLADHEWGRTAELRDKIWSAIRISRSFTAWDVAMLSGATLDYTKRYIAALRTKGWLEKIGKKGQKAIYRPVTELPAATPKMRSRSRSVEKNSEREDLMALGWSMMRALRDGEMTAAAKYHAHMCEKLHVYREKKVQNNILTG